MNWDALGAIAELIGGVAVLATLVYLSIQIRQNTESSKESILRNQTDRYIANSYFMAGESGIMDVFIRAMDDPDSVTREEWWRFGTALWSLAIDWEEMFYLNDTGRQNDYRWKASKKHIVMYLNRPGGKKWWKSQAREMLSEEFVAYVDSLLANPTKSRK